MATAMDTDAGSSLKPALPLKDARATATLDNVPTGFSCPEFK